MYLYVEIHKDKLENLKIFAFHIFRIQNDQGSIIQR